MSASGSCRTSCARSLYEDLAQLYQHFAPSTRTISAKSCASKSEIATLPAFRALDMRDLRRGLHFETKNVISPAFRALDTHDLRRRLHFEIKNASSPAFGALDTRDLRRGFTFWNHASEVLRLPRNHEPRSYNMLHWPRKSIPKLQSQKCNPSQELSPSTSKHRIHGADSLRLPRKAQSFEWRTPANVLATSTKYCACHDFHNVSDSLHLPRKLTFLTSTCDGFLAPATQHEVHVRKRTRTPGKTRPSRLRKPRRQLCASLRSRNQHRISKRHSAQTKPPAQSAYPNRTRPLPLP